MMNIKQENVIDRKYAFLLGSALRNEDTDQLFTVYDKLIPQEIQSIRLERIKEEARNISELPEDEFNALVLNARNFSLASGHYSMTSHTSGYHGVENEDSRIVSEGMAEDHNVEASRSSRNSQKVYLGAGLPKDSLSLDLHMDEDSGLPASKATESLASSFNDEDCDNSNDDCRSSMVFDYIQPRPSANPRANHRDHVAIRQTHNPHYDEAEVVGSGSSSAVESPRSENSVTHDDYSFTDRLDNMEMGQEMQDMSGRGMQDRIGHKYLYGSRNPTSGRGQSINTRRDSHSFSDDEMVDDEQRPRTAPRFQSGQNPAQMCSRLETFSYNSIGLTDHQKEGALRSSYNCRDDATFQSSYPRGKKKIGSKDDSDKSVTTHKVDVNGNPPLQQAFDLSNYSQMRQSDNSIASPATLSSSATSHGISSSHSANSQENSKFEEKKRAKERKLKRQQGKSVKSDQVQNYKGEQDLNSLLDYIEGKKATGNKTTAGNNSGQVTETSSSSSSSPTGSSSTAANKGFTAAASSSAASASRQQPLAQEKVNKRKTDKAVPKERQNDTSSKITADVASVNGPNSSTGRVIMGNNSDKDSQGDAAGIMKAPSKALSTEKSDDSNVEGSYKNLTNDSLDKASESIKTHKKEDKVSNNIDQTPQKLDLVKTQGDSKRSSKHKESTKNIAPKKEKETTFVHENGPTTLIKSQNNFVSVDSSSPSDIVRSIDFIYESKREPDFTEVKKKKKRVGARENNTFPSFANTNSHSNPSYNNNFFYRNNGSSSYRPRQRMASPPVTPGFNNTHNSMTNAGTGTNNTTTTNTISTATTTSSTIVNSNINSIAATLLPNTGATLPVNCIENPTNSGNHGLSRDLSPSSFPVLHGHAQPPGGSARSDCRRNSCGDLSSSDVAVAQTLYYDSDKESVKSLPAAPGATRPPHAGDASPMYLVSYARIAAAPRRSDISHSPSSESGVASGSLNGSISGGPALSSNEAVASSLSSAVHSPVSPTPDRKATVWKGSPRERRHSEGDNNSLNPRGWQKSGSQECLTSALSSDAEPGAPSSSVPSVSGAICPSSSSNSLPSDIDLQEEVLEVSTSAKMMASPSGPSSLAKATPSSMYANQSTTSSANPASSCVESTGSFSQQQFPLSPSSSAQKEMAEGPPPRGTSRQSGVDAAVAPSAVAKKMPAQDLSKRNLGTSTNNPKSVIFLDKRFGGKSQNLDITFGFDSSYQSEGEAEDKTIDQPSPALPASSSIPASSPPSSSSPLSSLSPSSSSTGTLTSAAGTNSLSNSPASSNIPSLMAVPQTPAIIPPHASSDNSNKLDKGSSIKSKVPKGPHIAGSSNGIILPARSANLSSVQSHPPSANVVGPMAGNDSSKPSLAMSSSACSNSSSSVISNRTISSDVIHTVSVTNSGNRSGKVYPLSSSSSSSPSSSSSKHASDSSTLTKTVGDAHGPSPQMPAMTITSSAATASAAVTVTRTPTTDSLASAVNPVQVSSQLNQPSSLPKEQPPTVRQPSQQPPASSELPGLRCPPNALRVIYGQKIKPSEGCGSLMFLPPTLPKKQRRDNVQEISAFLRRRWTEVNDGLKKQPPTFITVSDK